MGPWRHYHPTCAIPGSSTARANIRTLLHLNCRSAKLAVRCLLSRLATHVCANSNRLAIVWQDALLSLAFDRLPASQEMDIESDLPVLGRSGSSQACLSYRQAMNWLCHLTIQQLRLQKEAPLQSGTSELLRAFDALDASLSPHLSDRRNGSTILDIQEHYSFELRRNFALSTLCRPILSRQARQSLGEEFARMLGKFQDALKRSVLAFVRLRSISNLAMRS